VEMETAEISAESTEEDSTPEHSDHVDAAFFESAAVAHAKGEDSGEWTTPEYALAETNSAAKGEDEGEGEGGAEWQAPEYSDSASLQVPNGVKEYAKVVIPASAAEPLPSGILLEAANAADTTVFRPRTVGGRHRNHRRRNHRRSVAGGKSTKRRHSTLMDTPKRYKVSDRLVARPRWNRFDPFSPRHPNPQREQARAAFERATHLSYDRLEAYCSTRLPELFGKFCRVVLRRFHHIAEGLRYGDRPNQVCMAIKMCPTGSYVRKNVHNVFKRFHNHA